MGDEVPVEEILAEPEEPGFIPGLLIGCKLFSITGLKVMY